MRITNYRASDLLGTVSLEDCARALVAVLIATYACQGRTPAERNKRLVDTITQTARDEATASLARYFLNKWCST